MQETWVGSLNQEDPLEKEMGTHSSTLTWEIPWWATVHTRACVLSHFSCDQLWKLWIVVYQTPLSIGSGGKNTGVGCHFLLHGIFPTQGSNLRLLRLPALAARFLTTSITWKAQGL